MKLAWLALVAVGCNAGAQLVMKLAGDAIMRDMQAVGVLAWVHPLLLAALALYGTSFILTVRVFAANDLTVAGPAMAGGAFVLVALAGALILGETLSAMRIAGIATILGGIVLLSRSA